MNLVLTIAKSQPGGAPVGTSRVFESRGATLGRAAGNDWVFPDAKRHLSGRHCEIAFRNGAFVVTDTSANGVFVNGALLGKGNSSPLREGDRLGLYDEYELVVRLEETPAQSLDAIAVDPDDPFGIKDIQQAPDPQRAWAQPNASLFPAALPEDEDFLASEAGAPASREAWPAQPMADDVPAEFGAFEPPRVSGGAIPDDWSEDIAASRRTPASIAPPITPPMSPPVANAPAPRSGPAAGAALAAFLEGARMSPSDLGEVDAIAAMRVLGETYRAAIEGLREILMTRTQVKSEFRLEQTRISAFTNNPLKFSGSPEEALLAMIAGNRPGFAAPPVAMREAVQDIKAHQLATIAAIQVALTNLLDTLDPDTLKDRLAKSTLIESVLPATRKARMWEAFEATHAELAKELADDFHGNFGKAFAEAYEAYVRRR